VPSSSWKSNPRTLHKTRSSRFRLLFFSFFEKLFCWSDRIEELLLNECEVVTGKILDLISDKMKNLRRIYLCDCAGVKKEDIEKFTEKMKNCTVIV
jgi:hypothetical protein